jgi:hypothetical protein
MNLAELYARHFINQSKGLVPKNQQFYVVNPAANITAKQIIQDRQHDDSLRRQEGTKKI